MTDGPVGPAHLALRLTGSAAGGAALMFAFPPYSLWWLAPVGVAALVLAVRGLGPGPAALVGLVHGLAFFVPLLHWTGVFVGAAPWLLLAITQAGFHAALGSGVSLVTRLRGWPLWAAALYVGEEALRTRLPWGGFPWGRLGFAAVDSPYVHLAAVAGVPFMTFAVALTGTVLALTVAELWQRRWLAGTLAAGGAVALLLLPLAVSLPAPGRDSVRVAVVQGNVPQLGLDFNAQRQAVLRNHVQRTLELAARIRAGTTPRPDLVVWPENSSDIDPFEDPSAHALISSAVRAVGVPVLVGAVLDGPGRFVSNAGIVWGPETGPGERYVKRHPVPFGEYIPLRSLARRVTDKVDRVGRDFIAGDRVGVLDLNGVLVGDVICFEVGYDGIVRDTVDRGAQLLVVQTNNATFGFTPQTEQQLQMSRARAVEHGRTVLVAATSGVSAIVDPHGRVTQRAAVFTPAVLEADVPLSTQRTLASRLGAGPEWGIAALGLAAIAVSLILIIRQRGLSRSRRPGAGHDTEIREGSGMADTVTAAKGRTKA